MTVSCFRSGRLDRPRDCCPRPACRRDSPRRPAPGVPESAVRLRTRRGVRGSPRQVVSRIPRGRRAVPCGQAAGPTSSWQESHPLLPSWGNPRGRTHLSVDGRCPVDHAFRAGLVSNNETLALDMQRGSREREPHPVLQVTSTSGWPWRGPPRSVPAIRHHTTGSATGPGSWAEVFVVSWGWS